MPHPQRRTAIITITLFFIGVSDMSKHAISFEGTQTGAAPEVFSGIPSVPVRTAAFSIATSRPRCHRDRHPAPGVPRAPVHRGRILEEAL